MGTKYEKGQGGASEKPEELVERKRAMEREISARRPSALDEVAIS